MRAKAPDRATLLALADRCEQATGPDRELDGAIATSLGWTDVHGSVLRADFQGGRPPGVIDWWDHVPRFTASLDAARTISEWVLLHASDIGADGLALVELGNPTTTPTGLVRGVGYGGGQHALVLALCAAALRALAAEASAP